MSHKKIIHKCVGKLKKDEKHYEEEAKEAKAAIKGIKKGLPKKKRK